MQPENNRPPDDAEDSAGNDANDGAFTPGESFTNDPSDTGGTGELPSWLQNFAGVAGDPPASGQNDTTTATGERTASQPEIAPAQPHVSQSQPAEPTPEPLMAESMPDMFTPPSASGDSTFFSEDDLPEWLRALNTDSEPAAVSAPTTPMQFASAAPNGALPVPAVSRAWVTASDHPEISPAANLMSSLVNVIDSRPDAVAVEPAVSTPGKAPSVKEAAPPQAAAPVAAGPATTSSAEERAKRTRMLLIAAIIVLVLIIVVMLLGN